MKKLELLNGKMIFDKFNPNGSSTIYDFEEGDQAKAGSYETDSQGRIDGFWRAVEIEVE